MQNLARTPAWGQLWVAINAGLVVQTPEAVAADVIRIPGVAGIVQELLEGRVDVGVVFGWSGEEFPAITHLYVQPSGEIIFNSVVDGVSEDQVDEVSSALDDILEREWQDPSLSESYEYDPEHEQLDYTATTTFDLRAHLTNSLRSVDLRDFLKRLEGR